MLKAICEACGKRILAFCAASGKLTLLLWQTLRRLKDAGQASRVAAVYALLAWAGFRGAERICRKSGKLDLF